ncbi:MAG: hypothetical protein AABW67_00880 [Nanoarchaeota archaeon]
MPGILSHLIAAFIGFIIILAVFHKSRYKWKYGLVFVIGTIIPDAIKFGVTGLEFGTTDYYKIMSEPLYSTLNNVTHHIYFWLLVFTTIFLIILFLDKLKKINVKTAKAWIIADVVFLAAIVIHLIMDYFIIEQSYWI